MLLFDWDFNSCVMMDICCVYHLKKFRIFLYSYTQAPVHQIRSQSTSGTVEDIRTINRYPCFSGLILNNLVVLLPGFLEEEKFISQDCYFLAKLDFLTLKVKLNYIAWLH